MIGKVNASAKGIVKLTESDLEAIVKKVLSEQDPMRTAVKTSHDVAKYKISLILAY